jgi:peptide/nickel transport system substrate-binding protein
MRPLMYTVAGMFTALSVLAAPSSAAELKIALSTEPTSIDPHYHNLSPNNALATHIFGALIEQDETQQLKPGLALSWKPINDTTWEFKLRQGVKFHDGSPFTAEDVAFTMKRAGNVPDSPSSFGIYTKPIKEVKVVDPHTVHFITEKPYPLMPNDVSTVRIVSKKHGEGATTSDYNSRQGRHWRRSVQAGQLHAGPGHRTGSEPQLLGRQADLRQGDFPAGDQRGLARRGAAVG